MVTPAAKREAVAHLQTALGMGERPACAVVRADHKSIRYRSYRADDGDLRSRLPELSQQRRRFGYRWFHILLRRDGIAINRKKTQRLYREEGLAVRRRKGRKRAAGARTPARVLALALPNQRWSLDFVHDQIATGRRFRILNIVDDVTRASGTAHLCTGAGKTVVAFQICGRLRSISWNGRGAHHKPKIPFLADRDILMDDPKDKTFTPFADARCKLGAGAVSHGRDVYFSTRQAIARDERGPGLYHEFALDFFDLIISTGATGALPATTVSGAKPSSGSSQPIRSA